MRDGVLLCNRAQPGESRPGSARKHCEWCGHPVWVYWINLMYEASIICGECSVKHPFVGIKRETQEVA